MPNIKKTSEKSRKPVKNTNLTGTLQHLSADLLPTDEARLFEALQSPRIDTNTPKTNARIIQELQAWAQSLSIRDDDMESRFFFVSSMIRENYGFLSVQEINLAHLWAYSDRYDGKVEVENFGEFSVPYVHRILRAYCHYRKKLLGHIYDTAKGEQERQEAPPEPTDEEKRKAFIDALKLAHHRVQDDKVPLDFRFQLYSFLKKTGRIVITDELVEAAKAHASEMANSEMGQLDMLRYYHNRDRKSNKETDQQFYGKLYILTKYLQSIGDIDSVCQSITVEEIKNYAT